MIRLALALLLLVFAVVQSGDLGGWRAAWHARRARALANEDPDAALGHRVAALEAVRLSRKHRLALGAAVDEAVPRIGIARVVELAPPGALGRSVVATVLDRYGDARVASAVRSVAEEARSEEIMVLSAADLRQIGLDAAAVDRCREALPALRAAALGDLGDASLRLKYARCSIEAEDPSTAIDLLLPLYLRGGQDRWTRLLLARAEADLGHLQTAALIAFALARADPDFYDVWRFGGQLMMMMGRSKDAARAYRRAFAIRPENEWLQWDIWRAEKLAREQVPRRLDPSPAPAAPEAEAPKRDAEVDVRKSIGNR